MFAFGKFVGRSKGLSGAAQRAGTIARRFDWSGAKLGACMDRYAKLLERCRLPATIFVPGATLQAHAKRLLVYNGHPWLRFGIHGWAHIDLMPLEPAALKRQIALAVDAFRLHKIAFQGFRAPYLRWSFELTAALASTGAFTYDSSRAVEFPGVDAAIRKNPDYVRALELYYAADGVGAVRPFLPHRQHSLIELPPALPEDEILIDRLAITDAAALSGHWRQLAHTAARRDALFVALIHPERIPFCETVLEQLVPEWHSSGMWMTGLEEIADWWNARAGSGYRVARKTPDRLILESFGSADVTWRMRQASGGAPEWTPVDRRAPLWVPARYPGLRLEPGVPERTAQLLRDQGYLIDGPADLPCALACDAAQAQALAEDGAGAGDVLARAQAPLLRADRWPQGKRGAFCLSGDLDAMSLGDFVRRSFSFKGN